MIFKLFLLFFSILLLSCNTFEKEKDYTFFKTDKEFRIGLNNPSRGNFYPIISKYQNSDTSYCYYFCAADTSLRVISFTDAKEEVVKLREVLNNRINYSKKFGADLFLETPNIGWFNSDLSDSLYQIDFSKKKILNSISKEIEDYYLSEFNNKTFINSYVNQWILGVYDSLKIISNGVFKQEKNRLIRVKKMGEFPNSYRKQDMYINSSLLTILSKDSLLISYHFSDSVDLYVNYNFVGRIEMKSDSSILFTGFMGDEKDINAVKKYFVSKQRYNQLLYDKSKKLFYRVFTFEKESKGKISFSDKWSISVFNESFDKVYEKVFNYNDYYQGYCMLNSNGNLLISNVKKSNFKSLRDSSNIIFDEFKFLENSN